MDSDLRDLSDRACIVGVGQTDYSKASGRSVQTLALQAARAAIADAGLKPADIDAILPYVLGPTSDEMAAQLGISDLRYSSIIKMGGATFVACLETAALLIHNKIARNVLVFCARNGRSGTRVTGRVNTIPGQSFRRDFESPYGFSVPGQWYAMIARRHMIEFGTTREDAGHFAVADAQARQSQSERDDARRQDVDGRLHELKAGIRPVPPARLLPGVGRCRRLHRRRRRTQAKDMPHKPVYISGAAQAKPACSDDLCNRPDMFEIGLTKAAPRAFAMAGMKPSDMDGAMIYDCFSYVALLELEEAGLLRARRGRRFRQGRPHRARRQAADQHPRRACCRRPTSPASITCIEAVAPAARRRRRAADPECAAHRRHRLGRPRRRRARGLAELTDMATRAEGQAAAGPAGHRQRPVLERHRQGRAPGQALRRLLALPLAAAAGLSLLRLGQSASGSTVAPKGEMFSWTVVHRSQTPGFETETPYAVVLVELDDAKGVRMVGNLVERHARPAQGRAWPWRRCSRRRPTGRSSSSTGGRSG